MDRGFSRQFIVVCYKGIVFKVAVIIIGCGVDVSLSLSKHKRKGLDIIYLGVPAYQRARYTLILHRL